MADHEYTVCLFSFIINLFHLTVLTRKYMRTCSIYIFLISMCLCELYSMLMAFKPKIEEVLERKTECSPPSSLIHVYFDRFSKSLGDNSLRLSTWLTVALAAIRILVLRSEDANRFQMLSAPGFGWLLTFLLFILSFVLSLMHYFKYQIQEVGLWTPSSGCDSITLPPLIRYTLTISDLYTFQNGILADAFFIADGFFTHCAPCSLLLILIILLSFEILKSAKIRRKDHNDQNPLRLRNEQTTKLVNFLALIAFLIQFCYSGIFLTELVIGKNAEFLKPVKVAMNWVSALNSSSRVFFCSMFSCRYRCTVRRMFCFGNKLSSALKPRPKNENPSSLAGTSNRESTI